MNAQVLFFCQQLQQQISLHSVLLTVSNHSHHDFSLVIRQGTWKQVFDNMFHSVVRTPPPVTEILELV